MCLEFSAMEKLREEVIANVRGCLISIKGKLDIRELSNDYRQLMGTEIPYKRLNHQTLEDFLKSVPSLSVIRTNDGKVLVDAKATDKTLHISNMVSRQKTTKKKTRVVPPRIHRINAHEFQTQPPGKWRPKNYGARKPWENSPRPAAIQHNQFVNIQTTPKKTQPARLSPKLPLTTINNNTVYKDAPKTNNNVNKAEGFTKPRQILSREPSYDSDSSSIFSSLSSNDKMPNSAKTNRANLLPRKTLQKTFSEEKIKAATSPFSSDSDVPNPKCFNKSGDHLVDLINLSKYHKLPEPTFKVKLRQTKPHKPTYYDCQIKVDNQSFSSYPKDFKDEIGAKYHAAQLAVEKLVEKYGTDRRKSMLLSNEVDILERIPPLVQKHFNGIWSWQLELDYKDMYNEQLPMNWLEVADMNDTISVEGFNDKFVLKFCNPEDKGKFTSAPLACDVSIPTSRVEFPEQGVLLAVITCALSTKEIWCIQEETSESVEFDNLMLKMQEVYNRNYEKENSSMKAKNITKGSYYVAWKEGLWSRVRILEILEAEVQCLLVDTGEDTSIVKDDIYDLIREFATVQSQAFLCHLAGLEELYEVSMSSEHLQKLEGHTVLLEMCSEEGDDGNQGSIPVVIYDVVSHQILNKELISLLSIENALPVLDETALNEVYVSHVEPNGHIYLQIRSLGYKKLETLLEDLESEVVAHRPSTPDPITPQNSADRLYLIKHSEDKHYCRVKIIDWPPGNINFAQIYYVDFGFTRVIKMRETTLYPLDELSSVVSKFPEQALLVTLDLKRIPKDFVPKVRRLVIEDAAVVSRFVSRDAEGIPKVNLFVRVPQIGLVSVSDSINDATNNREIVNSMPEKLEKLISLDNKQKNVPSSGNLKHPTLPKVGEYYDVRVPFAVSPWNFFIQPYSTFEPLTQLMAKLQTSYANVTYSPLRIEDITPGKIYASKHEDGNWYRTSVIKVIHSGSISVFYCDFGYYANLRLQQLVPLEPQFLELPYQAIKAKLAGIKPKQDKWTMEDCKFFQKQVCGKPLVSILTAIEKDELYRCDLVLVLKLIDTSTQEDVYIEKLLVKKGIAVHIDEK